MINDDLDKDKKKHYKNYLVNYIAYELIFLNL